MFCLLFVQVSGQGHNLSVDALLSHRSAFVSITGHIVLRVELSSWWSIGESWGFAIIQNTFQQQAVKYNFGTREAFFGSGKNDIRGGVNNRARY